ncbi:hypothetical protein IWQ60_009122 [Tieghemiomyces parasiticus]|uniref:Uncharacterized protein n=1 Tax=Tieghemiomyces parasiticus TaxID=78921 RepID=A0A9W8DQN8_9FUNG|nr:hypothetical protein IWQ60_009122 [Tieghemiomyces parasiticus]
MDGLDHNSYVLPPLSWEERPTTLELSEIWDSTLEIFQDLMYEYDQGPGLDNPVEEDLFEIDNELRLLLNPDLKGEHEGAGEAMASSCATSTLNGSSSPQPFKRRFSKLYPRRHAASTPPIGLSVLQGDSLRFKPFTEFCSRLRTAFRV